MNDLYDMQENKDSIVNENNGAFSIRRTAFSKTISINKRNVAFAEILQDNGGLPKNNECLLIKTTGVSDTGSIFDAIDELEPVEELYLATWIIGRAHIEYLMKAIDTGTLKKLIFVISVRQKQLKKADYAFLIEELQKRTSVCKFKVCNSHAKTFSVKTKDNYYTVTGSGNWTKNPRIENYIITNDKAIFDFNKEWMLEMVK